MSRAIFQIEADLAQLGPLRRMVQARAEALKVDPEAMYDILLAATEMATNIIEHGYQGRPGKIEIEVNQVQDALVIRLRDQAPVFDPTTLPAPDLTLPLERRPLGGFGVYITMQLMDQVSHQTPPQGGNELTLIKNRVIQHSAEEKTNEHKR